MYQLANKFTVPYGTHDFIFGLTRALSLHPSCTSYSSPYSDTLHLSDPI